jgi:hypothetical protein
MIWSNAFGSTTGSTTWKIIPPRYNFPEQPGATMRAKCGRAAHAYFLTKAGVLLNQAITNYGMSAGQGRSLPACQRFQILVDIEICWKENSHTQSLVRNELCQYLGRLGPTMFLPHPSSQLDELLVPSMRKGSKVQKPAKEESTKTNGVEGNVLVG